MSDDFDSDSTIENDATALVLTDDEKTMALLAHILPIGTGFIGPLIILLVKGDDSEFVKYHSMQSLAFMGIFTVSFVALYIMTCGLGVILMLPAIPFIMAGQVYIGIQAQKGQWLGYPGIDKIGRK
ncbi:MAG: putative membrane protein [Myxococcota bacterium]|jgi:uncharacterized membrane protein